MKAFCFVPGMAVGLLFAGWSCGGSGGTILGGTGGGATSGSSRSASSGTTSSGSGGATASSSSGSTTSSASSSSSTSTSSSSTSASSSTSTSSSSSASSSTSASSSSTAASSSSSSGSATFVPTTAFTILLENHDYKEIVGSSNAPYINSLIAKYGLATNYMDSGTHPSLPNYLYMISGNTQYAGLYDVDPTALYIGLPPVQFPVNADNLGHQLTTANIAWRSYQESMGAPCQLAAVGTLYAPKHDPFLYFTNIQNGPNGLCAQTSVDYSQFAADLAAGTYRYMWITPNLTDDGHDPSATPADIITGLKQSDTWLSTEVPKILASSAYKNGGVLFITWDEAEGRNGDSADQVPMIVVTEGIKSAGYKASTAYSHANYLATVEDMFGLPRLGAAAGKAAMTEFWQ